MIKCTTFLILHVLSLSNAACGCSLRLINDSSEGLAEEEYFDETYNR